MRYAVVLVLILFWVVVPPALAQSDTPTPMPTPTPTDVPAFPIPTFDLITAPTSVPTVVAATVEAGGLPLNQVYDYLATAYVNLNNLPTDPTKSNGVALLPQLDTATIFGIARWLFSTVTEDELFGPFSGLVNHFLAYLIVTLIFTNIILVVQIFKFVLRWLIWVYTQVTKLIP